MWDLLAVICLVSSLQVRQIEKRAKRRSSRSSKSAVPANQTNLDCSTRLFLKKFFAAARWMSVG